jgi:hypothetical protein
VAYRRVARQIVGVVVGVVVDEEAQLGVEPAHAAVGLALVVVLGDQVEQLAAQEPQVARRAAVHQRGMQARAQRVLDVGHGRVEFVDHVVEFEDLGVVVAGRLALGQPGQLEKHAALRAIWGSFPVGPFSPSAGNIGTVTRRLERHDTRDGRWPTGGRACHTEVFGAGPADLSA